MSIGRAVYLSERIMRHAVDPKRYYKVVQWLLWKDDIKLEK